MRERERQRKVGREEREVGGSGQIWSGEMQEGCCSSTLNFLLFPQRQASYLFSSSLVALPVACGASLVVPVL